MSAATGVLTVLSQSTLRDEADRVAAAVGIRVVHGDVTIADRAAVNQKTWSAATAVLLDAEAAVRCRDGGFSRRPHVIVLATAEPTAATWQAAIGIGAQHVLTMPGDADDLVRHLAEAGEAARNDERRGDVLAVIGGRGGAGASLFAAAVAELAGDVPGGALLVDLDPCGGGIDLLVGSEDTPGLRWPDLALREGRLAWPAVHAALPRHRGVSVLSGDRCGREMDPCAVEAVLDSGRRGGATVICDVPRGRTEAGVTALATADLVVMISPCDVRSCAASSAMAPRLRGVNPNVGLVVRGPAPGGLRAAEVAGIVGLPLLASMRAEPRLSERLEHGGLRLPRRSALAAAARRVLQVLPAQPRLGRRKVAAA